MAGYIRGITIEFGADTTKLNAALKKTDGALNKTQAELKQINRSLKFNPGNTTLLRQKFELLQKSVTETRAKLTQLKQMQQNMNAAGVDKNSAQYRELQREIIKTENNLKQAEGALKRFGSVGKQQALAVGNAFKTAGNRIKSVGRTITTTVSVYGLAGIYAGAKLIESYQKQAEAELKLESVYKKSMGAGKKATETTLAYAAALQEQGVIGDEVTIAGASVLAQYAETPNAVNKMLPALDSYLAKTKGLDASQEDAETAAKMFGKAMTGNYSALEKNGIKLTENQKKMLDNATEEERAALLAEIITKKTGDMNAELAKTDAGKIQQAKNTLGDMGEEIGAVLLPAVADLATWISKNLLPKIQTLISWFQQHPKVATFALALAGITAVLGPLIMIFGSLVSMIGGVITIATALAPVIGAISAPVLAVVAAIAAAIAIGVALYKNWDTIKAKASQVFTAIKTTVTTNFNTLKNTVTTVWNAIKNAITKPIETAKNTVSKAIQKIKSFFPLKIGKLFSGMKLPHFTVKGKAPFGIGGKGEKPGISVQWYKKAMQQPYMFSNATLFGAGERGDEMLYGRNALMKDIANAMASVGGGGDMIVNVYGSDNMSVNELAAAVEQRIITMQKRRTQAWA